MCLERMAIFTGVMCIFIYLFFCPLYKAQNFKIKLGLLFYSFCIFGGICCDILFIYFIIFL